MTISSTIRKAGPFIGNNTATTFAFVFKVFASSDLLVVTADAAGVETALDFGSDYSVALNGDQDGNPGGSVTLLAGALVTGLTLVILSAALQVQGVAVTNQSGFYPDILNGSLDLLTILVQQLQEAQARTLLFPVTDTASAALPTAPLRAGRMLGFDGAGNVTLISVAPGGTIPGGQTAAGALDGVNRDFTFIAAAGATPMPLVFAGGVYQDLGTDYGLPVFVAGSTWKITFTLVPENGPIKVVLLA